MLDGDPGLPRARHSRCHCYRGNSSIGAIGHSRTGLLVAEDPNDCQ